MSTEGMDTRELDELVKTCFARRRTSTPTKPSPFEKEGNKGRRLLRAKTKAVTKKKPATC